MGGGGGGIRGLKHPPPIFYISYILYSKSKESVKEVLSSISA